MYQSNPNPNPNPNPKDYFSKRQKIGKNGDEKYPPPLQLLLNKSLC